MSKVCSAVVLNYKDYESTLTCLSYLKACPSIDYIIVVDNNSPNESAQVLAQAAQEDPSRIFFIQTAHNGGYGAGNNAGVRFSIEKLKTDFALIINPDVEIEEDAIVKMLQALEEDNRLALVAPQVEDTSADPLSHQGWKVPRFTDELRFMYSLSIKLFGDPTVYKNPPKGENKIYVECVSGACLMLKTDIFSRIGMYDERVFLFNEESILGFKLKEINARSAILTNARYVHAHSVSINKVMNLEKKILERNRSRDIYVYHYLKPNKAQLILYKLLKKLSFIDRKLLLLKRVLVNKDRL
ncbi:MAG: glycosyltransferase [Coriobacteriia bacterium]|nr:glycosyltransferase [Coriobacteriia bacterium]